MRGKLGRSNDKSCSRTKQDSHLWMELPTARALLVTLSVAELSYDICKLFVTMLDVRDNPLDPSINAPGEVQGQSRD